MKYYDIVILDNTIIYSKKIEGLDILNANQSNKDIHASLIFQILKNNIKSYFTALNIDITNEITLVEALEYIVQNVDCKYINISAGIESCDYDSRKRMYDCCNELIKRGSIIVAGGSNMGRITYPAAFDNVLSVDSSIFCKNINDYEIVYSNIVNIRGFSGTQSIRLNNEVHKVAGTSFIVPRIIAELWKRNIRAQSIYDILDQLTGLARKIYKSEIVQKRENELFTIKNAIVFPYNKEIGNLVANEDLLKFSIFGVFDYKMTGNIGKLIHEKHICNYENISWETKDFDTLILGHVEELSGAYKRNFLDYFVDLCISNSKNIVTFDNMTFSHKQKILKAGLKYYEASFNKYYLEEYKLRFGKLRYFSVPIIGIFGTSPKQGKFTLQIKLYRLFREYGYKVELFGTEPISSLIADGESYPCGYGTEMEENAYKQIQVINEKLFNLEDRGCDLIILASQSQTVPAGFGNLGMYPTYQQNILLASLPDAIILCINYEDDNEYVNRTINFIESISATKVIAISIFAFKKSTGVKLTKGEFSEKVSQLRIIYSGSIFFCEEYEKIAEEIINYLGD